MTTFAQLTADQLAERALNIYQTQGRQVEGGRLLYRALELDPKHPIALRCLVDFLAHQGTEPFAASVLEYALSPACILTTEEQKTLDDLRFIYMWSWRFSQHKLSDAQLQRDAFAKREDFSVDHARYEAFVNSVVSHAGSLEGAYQAALTLCGSAVHFLRHTTSTAPGIDDCFNHTEFSTTQVYEEWLITDIEATQQASTMNGKPVSSAQQPPSALKKPWWKVW